MIPLAAKPLLWQFKDIRATILLSIALGVGWLVASNLSADEDVAPDLFSAQEIEFFEKSIRPILIEDCYDCHAGEERKGGLLLDSRDGWLAGGDSGQVLVPGKPRASRLIEALHYDNPDLQMPPNGKLPDVKIAALEKWVELGAVDPRRSKPPAEGTDTQPSEGRAPNGMGIEEGRRFWSFQPITNPQPPQVECADWVRTPVDAFVLHRLEQQGLKPAPRADKRILIRRVTFDLIGLPPTPEEVAAYLADDSVAAFERVVERLLASPQYGERWGRHWLDVARYADSNGLDENLAFGNAWRYRDYVVSSTNQDKPFDQFLVEQLAGDLLPQATQETLTGTGFLALGAKVLAEPDREKLTMDTIDEQIDATGKAFLGMTLGCVRCHDHKFDPITQQDYYALAAIFKSTRSFSDNNFGAIKYWYEHSFASEPEQKELAAIDAEIAAKQSLATQFRNKAMAELRSEAVKQAAKYLAACCQFEPSASLTEVRKIAEPLGLHARILHHCRLHLEYSQDDPLVAKWHRMAAADSRAAGSAGAVERFFQALFDSPGKPSENAGETPSAQPPRPAEFQLLLSHVRSALDDASGLISVPPQPEYAFDETTLSEYYRLMKEARLLESDAPDEQAVMGVSDGRVLASLPIHVRGSHRILGEPVHREFPAVMRTSSVRPVFPRDQSGRLELARWMASSQHPLTARVYVNRVWGWHFGRGLVASTENFGVLGDRPSHPDLLDWLARYFLESGWSTKALHRVMLASSTYQMQSGSDAVGLSEHPDPANNLLWQFRMQRLEAEQIRDAILAVSGRLDESIGGKTVPLRNRQFVFNHTSVDHTKYDSLRRAIYLPIIRNNLYTFFEQFDFPDPTMPTGKRHATVVAPQALLMLNDELVMDSADTLAQRILDGYSQDEQRVDHTYMLALTRLPTISETRRALGFLASLGENRELSEQKRWSLLCQSLLVSNEFIYVR